MFIPLQWRSHGGLGGAQAPPTQILASVGIAQIRGAKNIYMGGVPSFGHI